MKCQYGAGVPLKTCTLHHKMKCQYGADVLLCLLIYGLVWLYVFVLTCVFPLFGLQDSLRVTLTCTLEGQPSRSTHLKNVMLSRWRDSLQVGICACVRARLSKLLLEFGCGYFRELVGLSHVWLTSFVARLAPKNYDEGDGGSLDCGVNSTFCACFWLVVVPLLVSLGGRSHHFWGHYFYS